MKFRLESYIFFVIHVFVVVNGLNEADIEHRIQNLERKCQERMNTLQKENQILKHKLDRVIERQTKDEKDLKTLKGVLLMVMNGTGQGLPTETGDHLTTLLRNFRKRLLVGTQVTTTAPQTSVAFYARLMTKYDSLGERETVIYDRVVTNIGNGYDVNNGIFLCPISGIYLFAATVASDGGQPQKNIDAEIVHQGTPVARLHATLCGIDQGSQVVIILCQQGEKVWIRHMEGAGDSKTIPADYSGFSGALLHKL